ncbi:hypothetical protein ACFPAF_02155 [Hymenobacter endophyticus]|uniref:Uncharacterized protein n=1 Tax=Hymenobacter endophyticus TaxID=3076335 RepID=A0ABU3TCT5_9BACT|nr:hypothetical protein [Hymenobacter endophyticus]MDU0369183.1 hypothetical protein [Hymenobacter endophyticus]
MTDSYLRSLGFATTDDMHGSTHLAFAQAWRYQHAMLAQDGTRLFIEHPLGIAACRLSRLAAPLAAQDVAATVGLHDRAGLEAAIQAFFAAHGGVGQAVPQATPSIFRPYRRQL